MPSVRATEQATVPSEQVTVPSEQFKMPILDFTASTDIEPVEIKDEDGNDKGGFARIFRIGTQYLVCLSFLHLSFFLQITHCLKYLLCYRNTPRCKSLSTNTRRGCV